MTVILPATMDCKVEGHMPMRVSQGPARTLAWSRAPMPAEGCVLLGFYMQKKHTLLFRKLRFRSPLLTAECNPTRVDPKEKC